MKKIGVLMPFHDNYGGGEIFWNNLTEHCEKTDDEYRIYIFSSDEKAFKKNRISIPKINSYSLFFRNFCELCRIIDKENVDCLVLNDFFISQFALLFRFRFKKVYCVLHGEITQVAVENLYLKKACIFCRKSLINLGAKKVFTVNKTNVKYFNSKKTFYIGNFVVKNEKCGLQVDKDYDFIFVGRFIKLKNIFTMIDAFKIYCENFDMHSKIVMVGTGELLSEVKQYVENLKLKDNVIFAGFVPHDEILKFYRQSKCLLLFSRTEGLPTVILEALTCGIPCIVSNVGSNEDVVKNRINGFCFELGEAPSSIAKLMRTSLVECNELCCIQSADEYLIDNFWKRFRCMI